MAMTQQRMALLKRGDVGGSGDDTDFESSFSGIAHAYLQEKAAMLEPYELGFQLLERSDDGQRAVAITGFQVGDRLLYAPVFWLNGQIKGSELLFDHATSMFIPCKENWINYMLGRRPQRIGENVPRNPRQLGIRQPDLRRMTRSPYKFASETVRLPNWAICGELGLQDKAFVGHNKLAGSRHASLVSLPEFIESIGKRAVLTFAKLAEVSPEIALRAHEFHGERLIQALEKAAALEDVDNPRNADNALPNSGNADNTTADKQPVIVDPKAQVGMKLRVYKTDTTELPADLSDADREKLFNDGFMIHDLRPDAETSKAYSEFSHAHVSNPHETGLYDVITKTDGTHKCLVVSNPWGPDGVTAGYFVVSLESDSHPYLIAAHQNIWTTKQYTQSEFKQFVEALPTADELNTDGDAQVVLLNWRGVGTVPLQLQTGTWDEAGVVAYEVRPDTGHLYQRPGTPAASAMPRIQDAGKDNPGPRNSSGQLIVDNSGITKFRAVEGRLSVPNSAAVLKVGDRWSSNFELGRAGDLKSQVYTQLTKLSVFRGGNEVTLNYEGRPPAMMTPDAALLHLVTRVGLREGTARELLKTAGMHKVARCLVKVAEPYMTGEAPYALPEELDFTHFGSQEMLDGDSIPTNEYQPQAQSVGMPQEYIRQQLRPVHYVDDGAFNVARQAGTNGQKDVFDASAMTSMLRNMRDEQLIDRYIPSLVAAMDSVGRLLFQLYWHGEDFAERYGDRDMPELEDGLRNLFESQGDITLKLKQKSITPYPEEEGQGVDLTDVAGGS